MTTDVKSPFPLAYLDWCKKIKKVKDIKETERRDWVYEFYKSEDWREKDVNGIDFAVAMGVL
jgi:hypothetical protein